jgi:hypothetical protein
VGGEGVESTCYYVVPLVDRDDEVQTIRATGVARIAKAPATKPPSDIRKRFLMVGQAARLEQPTAEIDRCLAWTIRGGCQGMRAIAG